MMLIKKGPIYSYLEGYTSTQLKVIESSLSYNREYWIQGVFHKERIVTRKSLFDFKNKKILSGLVYRILQLFPETVVQEELRASLIAKIDESVFEGIILFPYEIEAIERGAKKERGIFHVATGGGKTEIIAGLLKSIQGTAVIFVDGQNLVVQTQERLEKRLKESIGIIYANKKELKDITIVSIDSFSRLREEIKEVLRNRTVTISDECHLSTAWSWFEILLKQNSRYKFGFSGTPLALGNERNLKLIGVIGPIIYKKTSRELIKEGYLAKPIIYFLKVQENRILGHTFPEVYEEGVVENENIHKAIVEIVRRSIQKDLPTLILVQRKKQGFILKKLLEQTFWQETFPFLSGNDNVFIREQIRKEIIEGKKLIVIASTIFDQGIDIPNLKVLVNTGANESTIRTYQRVGRSLRKKNDPKQNTVEVFDFYLKRHKFLAKHTLKRLKDYRREFDVKIVDEIPK